MRVEATRGVVLDKKSSKQGKIIAIASNKAELILLTCGADPHGPIWYIQAHLSTHCAEGDLINEPFYYVKGVGYVKISWDGIAMLTEQSPPKDWHKIYADAQTRITDECPFAKRGECPQIYCPFGEGKCRQKVG